MPILPVLSSVSQEVELNQPYNVTNELDETPHECRMNRPVIDLDDKPAECWDEGDEHNEYERLLHRLYVQGLRATQLA